MAGFGDMFHRHPTRHSGHKGKSDYSTPGVGSNHKQQPPALRPALRGGPILHTTEERREYTTEEYYIQHVNPKKDFPRSSYSYFKEVPHSVAPGTGHSLPKKEHDYHQRTSYPFTKKNHYPDSPRTESYPVKKDRFPTTTGYRLPKEDHHSLSPKEDQHPRETDYSIPNEGRYPISQRTGYSNPKKDRYSVPQETDDYSRRYDFSAPLKTSLYPKKDDYSIRPTTENSPERYNYAFPRKTNNFPQKNGHVVSPKTDYRNNGPPRTDYPRRGHNYTSSPEKQHSPRNHDHPTGYSIPSKDRYSVSPRGDPSSPKEEGYRFSPERGLKSKRHDFPIPRKAEDTAPKMDQESGNSVPSPYPSEYMHHSPIRDDHHNGHAPPKYYRDYRRNDNFLYKPPSPSRERHKEGDNFFRKVQDEASRGGPRFDPRGISNWKQNDLSNEFVNESGDRRRPTTSIGAISEPTNDIGKALQYLRGDAGGHGKPNNEGHKRIIDSEEAKRRYGHLKPSSIWEIEPNTEIIDSKIAIKKYGGRLV